MAIHDSTLNIPYGYCQCGCGQKTSVSKTNHKRSNRVKGEPAKFIQGHGTRLRWITHHDTIRPFSTREDGTIEIHLTRNFIALISPEDVDLAKHNWDARGKDHVYARKFPCISLHTIILERILGRNLVEGEIADHINRNTLDNRRGNLRLADKQKKAIRIIV